MRGGTRHLRFWHFASSMAVCLLFLRPFGAYAPPFWEDFSPFGAPLGVSPLGVPDPARKVSQSAGKHFHKHFPVALRGRRRTLHKVLYQGTQAHLLPAERLWVGAASTVAMRTPLRTARHTTHNRDTQPAVQIPRSPVTPGVGTCPCTAPPAGGVGWVYAPSLSAISACP